MKSASQPVPSSQEVTVLPRTLPVPSEIYESLEDDEWGGISDYEAAAMKRKAQNRQLLKLLGLLKVYDFLFC